MTKQVTKTTVPRLRFPEFCNAAEWEWKTLSHVCDMRAGKFIAASEISERPDERSYPCYGGNGLRGYTAGFTHSGRFPLIGRQGALCGNIQFVEGDFYATEHALVASPKAETDVGWLRYTLDGLNLNQFATGQAQPGLSVDVLNGVSCAVPGSESEQQKIADCLTSLDEVIAAQGRKVEALKAHKRGLMQQLFPREGETRPRLRFPEFRNAPEWDATSVGAWSKSFSGGTPPTTRADYYGGEIPFIRSAEIGSAKTDLSLTQTGLKASSAKLVDAGDVLLALYGANSGDVALAQTSGAINQAILCIRPNGSKAFLYHYLTAIQPWLVATFLQGGQGNLSGEIVKSVGIRVPSSEEQQRIADCLSSLDTRITAETRQLAALKTHKQGLMQQLFPAPEAAQA